MDIGYGGADDLFLYPKATWSSSDFLGWLRFMFGSQSRGSGGILLLVNFYLVNIPATSACLANCQHVLKLLSEGP